MEKVVRDSKGREGFATYVYKPTICFVAFLGFPLFKQMDLIYSLIYTVRVVWLAITFEKEFYVLPPFQSHGPTFLFGCLK